jgi:hypothetical protein
MLGLHPNPEDPFMPTTPRAVLAAAFLAALAPAAAAQQYLMVVDWTDRVMLVSAQDGSIINPNFIPDDPTGTQYNFQSPKAAAQVGNEIWVSDQISDAVYRFTAGLSPQFISAITGGMDNLRGIRLINNKVYVANFGSLNGAPGGAVLVYSTSGVFETYFTSGSPFDIAPIGDDLLVSNSNSDTLDRYSPATGITTIFHDSDGINGIDLPQQIVPLENGRFMVAGSITPGGIFFFNADGSEDVASRIATNNGVRGVARLVNGNLLYTKSGDLDGGLYSYDPASGIHTQIHYEPNLQYITQLNLAPACGTADFDGDGDTGTDADIEAFFACLAGNCCSTCWHLGSDFNADGDSGTDADIEAFFRVLAGNAC